LAPVPIDRASREKLEAWQGSNPKQASNYIHFIKTAAEGPRAMTLRELARETGVEPGAILSAVEQAVTTSPGEWRIAGADGR
jgi:hypothetical protein